MRKTWYSVAAIILAMSLIMGSASAATTDLSITGLLANPTSLAAGQSTTYTFNVNNSAAAATNASLAFSTPTNTTLTSAFAIPSGWVLSSGTNTAGSSGAYTLTAANYAINSTSAFSIQVKTASSATVSTGYTFTPTVSVGAVDTDSSLGNNSGTDSTVSVTSIAFDMSVAIAGSTTYASNGSRNVTITVNNAGPSDSPTITFFQIPITGSGVTVSNVTSSGTVLANAVFLPQNNNGILQVHFPVFTAGASGIVTYTETSTVATTYTETVNLLHFPALAPGIETNLSNDTASQIVNTVVVGNLVVTTGITPTPLAVGSIPANSFPAGNTGTVGVTMTNNAANSSPVSVTSLQVTLPIQFAIGTLVSPQSGFTVTRVGQVVTIAGASVANGTPVTINIPVSTASSLPNGTVLTIAAPVLSVSGGATQTPAPAGASTTTILRSDFSISFGATPATISIGSKRTVTMTVVNNGPSDAPAITSFSMPINSNVTITNLAQAASPTGGSVQSSSRSATTSVTVTFGTGSFPAAGNAIITFDENVALANSPASFNDVATLDLSLTTTVDPNLANNSATLASSTVLNADIIVSMSSSGTTAGGTRTITVTVTNVGPNNASNVVLVMNPAPGCVFSNFTQTGGTAAVFTSSGSPINTWTVATMAPFTNRTFSFVETINAGTSGTVTDTASATSSTPDPNAVNNTNVTKADAVTFSSDVGIGITGPSGTVAVGNTVTYTLLIVNNGPSNAQNVIVTDILNAANFTFVSQTQTQGTAFTLSNTGNTITDTIASLPLTGSTPVKIDVVVRVNQTVASGTALSNQPSITLQIPAQDTIPGNNNPAATSGLTANVQSDIGVSIATVPANTTSVDQGDNLVYAISIKNNGPSNNPGVNLSAVSIPVNTTFVSLTQSTLAPVNGATFALTSSPPPPVLTPGVTTSFQSSSALAIPAGQTVVLTLTVKVNLNAPIPGTISLTAATTSTTIDPGPTANTATLGGITIGVNSDVQITSLGTVSNAVTPGNIAPNNQIVYTFNVFNFGPSIATGVTVTDTLPAIASVVSVEAPLLSFLTPNINAGVLTIPIGTIQPGQTVAVKLVLSIPASASNLTSISNTVTAVLGVPANDKTPGNNSGTISVTVAPSADLSVTCTTSVDPVVAGNPITYNVTVSNAGPSDSQATTFTFAFPGPNQIKLLNIGAPPIGWTQTSTHVPSATSGTYTATVPTIPAFGPQATASFSFTFNVNSNVVTPLVNTITVTSTTSDPTSVGNINTLVKTVGLNPQPTVSIASFSVPEGDLGLSNATVIFTLSAPNTQEVSVDFATANGTANSVNDYQQRVGTVFFPAGTTSTQADIQILGNTIVEADKTFSIHLSNPVNTIVAQNDAVVTITNDDIGGVLQFSSASYIVNETAGTVTITVTRPLTATASNTTVKYATSDGTAADGVDYTGVSGTLTFNYNQSSASFTVPLLNKQAAIAGATFFITLSNPSSGVNIVPGATASLGTTKVTTVTILARPAINSSLMLNGIVGSQFSYSPTATGETPITYTLGANAVLPGGLIFSPGAGFITGVPTQVGSFTVPLVATNAVGTDTVMLVITISPLPNTTNSKSTLDSDGDGFSDELEIAVGSNPFDSKSTPDNIQNVSVGLIRDLKLAISLNFLKTEADSITLSGSVQLPSNFAQSGKLVYFDIGGVIRRFALDANGVSPIGPDVCKFNLKKKSTGTIAFAPFTLKITSADCLALLADEGLTNITVTGAPRTVPVTLLLNSSLYKVLQPQVYTAKSSQSGKTKNP